MWRLWWLKCEPENTHPVVETDVFQNVRPDDVLVGEAFYVIIGHGLELAQLHLAQSFAGFAARQKILSSMEMNQTQANRVEITTLSEAKP